MTEDLDNGSSSVCKESGCEIRTSHDICESSSGSDPAEIDHSGEEQGTTHYVGEPATTASEDASERSVGLAVETSKQATCLHIIKKKVCSFLRPLGCTRGLFESYINIFCHTYFGNYMFYSVK